MPIAQKIYGILWEQLHTEEAFLELEKGLV
jgi:hypothetical protein